MSDRARRAGAFAAAAAGVAITSWALPARAEETPRFRGGVSLEGSVMIVPDSEDSPDGGPGVSGRVGVQLHEALAIVVEPSIDLLVGQCCAALDVPLMAEVTLADRVALAAGVGPHAALSFLDRDGHEDEYGFDVAALYLRVAGYPVMEMAAPGGRRTGLAVSATLRTSIPVEYGVVVTPGIGVGYEAF